eukprot:CAMPEP_0174829704 /NCGR_PEP_ID=MMETSP1114-20130205/2087_1 /TAXON_ID=312471 /ORGANISM="Neobodo designis, Strain CCAP 1951/1" /LENGTH=592 /DNA_ID=CAMNT_0016063465 /DNA_START=47 /DNA_END=1825 /DNA_ORIENTATION=+
MSQAVTTESTITRAVVYSGNRAQVFRKANVTLAPGEHTVHVDGLWDQVDRDSLQVAMKKGGNRTTLRAVQFTSVTSVDDVRPQVAELEKQITAVKDDLAERKEDAALCEKAIESYEAVRRKVCKASATLHEGAPIPAMYEPGKWAAMSQFINKGITEQKLKQRTLNKAVDKVQAELDRLNGELRKLGPNHVKRTTKDVAELLFTVAADGAAADPVDLVLELSYLVSGASWKPAYDVRIDSKGKTMQLAYNANVRNSTGEDWKAVQLELSTAAGTTLGTMPSLRSWVIREPEPVMHSMNQFQYQQQEQNMMLMEAEEKCAAAPRREMMRQMMPTNMMPAAAAPPPPRPAVFRSAATVSADVKSSGGSSTFRVVAPATVKADNDPVKVAVTVLDLPVHFRYSAVPKLDPSVYLKVRAVNTSAFDILAGPANVFSDNQLVSNTRLDNVAPGEDFWTFLGTDDDITVKRVKEPHHTMSTTGGFLSSKKKVRAFTFHYTAKNMKGTEEELVIWDQYPIPQDKRITVDAKMPTSEATHTPCEMRPVGAKNVQPVKGSLLHKINDDRFIEWFVQAPPSQETKFDFSFTVEYPDEVRIQV